MQPPLSLKLLLWYYNRFLKLETDGRSAEQVRASVNGRTGRVKAMLNGEKIPLFKVEDRTIAVREGEVPVRIYWPNAKKALPVITYYHGGGFVMYGLDSHDHVCRRLCRDNGAVVVSVDYRLAPEHKFPTAVDDAYDALQWVSENAASLNGRADKIAVLGDSAGGNLAAVMSQLARDNGGPELAAQVLVYPVVDGRMQHPSIKENADGYILTEQLMRWFLDHYKRTDADIFDPRLSPILADNHSNLPPALVQVASLDPLRDEGIDYAETLKAAGNQVRLTNYEGLTHSFFSMPGLSKRCVSAYDEIKGFLAEQFAD
ncbi:MAG: alpha/beta hydrolase [Bacteroidota bacterium]